VLVRLGLRSRADVRGICPTLEVRGWTRESDGASVAAAGVSTAVMQ